MATYNLVNSVKGGCGKTTFSIWLAYYLNNMEENAALLIDMDLLGTSMQFIFSGNSAEPGKRNTEEETAYTNDIFKGVKNSKKDFVQVIKWGSGKVLNVIFASMKIGERDKFKSGRHSGYGPTVRHSIFRAGMKELLTVYKKIDDTEVKHYIFDMPPNSDGFSDSAMECILSKKYSDLKEGDKKNLFIMVGSDLGQTIATRTELEMLLTRRDEMMPDRIFVVFNHNTRGELGIDGYKLRKQLFEDTIKNICIKEEEKNRIFFLIMCPSDEYAAVGIGDEKGGIGLQNVDAESLFPKAVISAYAKYNDKEFTDITDNEHNEKKLLELVLGE